MLASDLANPEFTNPSDPDARLHVTFFIKPFPNEWKSAQEGRPIFEEVTMIRIVTPGDSTNIIETPAREDHKQRFPKHWAYFERTQGQNLQTGTPLAQWPILGPAQVEMLKAMRFLTVEQIATASDDQIQKVGMGGGMAPFALRDKARRFLMVAHDSAAVDKTAQEMEALKQEAAKKDEALALMQAQIAAMQEQMAKLAQPEEVRRGPGRPRKED